MKLRQWIQSRGQVWSNTADCFNNLWSRTGTGAKITSVRSLSLTSRGESRRVAPKKTTTVHIGSSHSTHASGGWSWLLDSSWALTSVQCEPKHSLLVLVHWIYIAIRDHKVINIIQKSEPIQNHNNHIFFLLFLTVEKVLLMFFKLLPSHNIHAIQKGAIETAEIIK